MRCVIRNGIIVDGTGRKPFRGDVEMEGGVIRSVTRREGGQSGEDISPDNRTAGGEGKGGARIIDAGGAFVTPGFIDIHRHGDWLALTSGDDELLNRQGITSVVNGNCGLSAAPQGGPHEGETEHFLRSIVGAKPAGSRTRGHELTRRELAGSLRRRKDGAGTDAVLPGEDPAYSMQAYMAALRRARRSVNTGMLIGGGTIRASVAGYGGGVLTSREEELIREKFRESLAAGALGVSLGLGYAPEFAYDEDGLVRVLEPVRGSGIPLAVHIRTEGDGADEAVAEMIRVARRLEVPLHLSHMKCIGKHNFRVTCAKELRMIRDAREGGMDISMDAYPYVTGSTQLVHLIPPGFQAEGTEALLKGLADPAFRRRVTEALKESSDTFENIVELAGFDNIAATGFVSETFRPYEGWPIDAVARDLKRDPYETLYDILLEEKCEPAMLDRYGCEEDMIDFLGDESCSLISDAIYPEGGRRHPRVYDAFPRFLIRYVRDREIFTIEEAVRKMTSLPASVYHLDRGVLAEGKPADICVFRLENLRSDADFSHPDRMCRGFDYVFTAGEAAVAGDRWRNTGTGSVL